MCVFCITIHVIICLDALTRQQRQFTGIHDEAGVQVQVICEEMRKMETHTSSSLPFTCWDDMLPEQRKTINKRSNSPGTPPSKHMQTLYRGTVSMALLYIAIKLVWRRFNGGLDPDPLRRSTPV